mmetsp:Transcript_42962/g.130751  ORF Transcript_42962/g.130751 Transcript_42962/m.130751 type:complete len:260 (-) Transcript_42962:89-868(-)
MGPDGRIRRPPQHRRSEFVSGPIQRRRRSVLPPLRRGERRRRSAEMRSRRMLRSLPEGVRAPGREVLPGSVRGRPRGDAEAGVRVRGVRRAVRGLLRERAGGESVLDGGDTPEVQAGRRLSIGERYEEDEGEDGGGDDGAVRARFGDGNGERRGDHGTHPGGVPGERSPPRRGRGRLQRHADPLLRSVPARGRDRRRPTLRLLPPRSQQARRIGVGPSVPAASPEGRHVHGRRERGAVRARRGRGEMDTVGLSPERRRR